MAAPRAAQGGDGAWQFSNLQQGYCITFLVSPDDAPGVLPGDAQPVRLDAMTDATPVLARVLADQPEYGSLDAGGRLPLPVRARGHWGPGARCAPRVTRR